MLPHINVASLNKTLIITTRPLKPLLGTSAQSIVGYIHNVVTIQRPYHEKEMC